MLLLLPQFATAEQKEAESRGESCLGCHEGIEIINGKMAAEWGADRRCDVCHAGQPVAATKLEAHTDLIRNPGDLRVVARTCGKCHSDHGEIEQVTIQGIDDHVGRVMRSVMATAAGEIAGTRYLWNEQQTRSALYGVRPVSDKDYDQPEGAVQRLQQLPPSANSDADSLLRGACLRCHLWTEDKTTPGVFRPGGCSACHVLYAADGLSRSRDATVSKAEPGHPERHAITTKIPDTQCLWCHNDGGARIGLSYVGLAVTNPTLQPHASTVGEKTAYGATVMHVRSDIHYRKGIACIDCHDSIDLHGDGNIYSHQEYQVGIRCETCHSNSAKPPTFRTEHGRAIRHVEKEGGKTYLRTRIFAERHLIPALFSDEGESTPSDDIWHGGHRKLECYACHSTNLPQCYCCHMVRDDTQPAPLDWALGVGEGQSPRTSSGMWKGRTLFQLWSDAVLGVNRRNRVAPFIPGGQAIFTHVNSDGQEIRRKNISTTAGGLYGFSMNPVQPHNISAESRTCPSCHSNRKAAGLGSAFVDLKRLGLRLWFSPDALVDERGARLQDSAHEGTRPLNQDELRGLLREQVCTDCHTETPNGPQGLLQPHMSLKAADEEHHRAIQKIIAPDEE